jgi:hypothetical protein
MFLIQHFHKPNKLTYVGSYKQNLLPGIKKEWFYEELIEGKGSELINRNGISPKFCSIASSTCLAVNSFTPWKQCINKIQVSGLKNFKKFTFEMQCPNGLPGINPNLDLFFEGDDVVLGVESKFLEIFNRPNTEFKKGYDTISDKRRDSSYFKLINSIRTTKRLFDFFDVAQIIRHYLGLTYCYKNKKIFLLYLYWRPMNWNELDVYKKHYNEIERFKKFVKNDSTATFLSMCSVSAHIRQTG